MSIDVRNDIKGLNRFLFTEGSDEEKLHLHISEVGPGTRAHPPHQHEGQEIFYVLKGKGEVLFGNEVHNVNSGEAIHVNCKVIHGISNSGTGSMRYAVIIAK